MSRERVDLIRSFGATIVPVSRADGGFLDSIAQAEAYAPVHDGDAILMAQALAARLGLGVGISSGANLVAALLAQEKLGDHWPPRAMPAP